MAKVQMKYHWGDFSLIKVQDPLTDEEVDFSHFKHFMSSNLTGIGIDLEQGQRENMLKQYQALPSCSCTGSIR